MIEQQLFTDLIQDFETGKVSREFVVQVATWRVQRICPKEAWNVYDSTDIDLLRNALPCTTDGLRHRLELHAGVLLA